METTPNGIPASSRHPIQLDISASTGLNAVEDLLAGLNAVEVKPVPYYEDEDHLIEVTRQTRRMCWDRHGEAPGEPVTISGHRWLLWLDRAETVELDDAGRPVAAFHIDRIED